MPPSTLTASRVLNSLARKSSAWRSISAAAAAASSLQPKISTAANQYASTLGSLSHNTFPVQPIAVRNFSSYGNNQGKLGGPSYQVYGESTALTVRAIPPEFRQLASGTIVTNNSGKGKLLLQWTPRAQDGKYQWDNSIRFALAAEEAASVFLARLDPQKLLLAQQQPRQHGSEIAEPNTISQVELVRRANNPEGGGFFDSNDMPEKVFRARLQGDGSVQLTVDYERNGVGGQAPPNPAEVIGPLSIDLMVGEFHVLRSIIQYAIPKLIGWDPALDSLVEQSIEKGTQNNNNNQGGYGGQRSPHNYGGGDGGVFLE